MAALDPAFVLLLGVLAVGVVVSFAAVLRNQRRAIEEANAWRMRATDAESAASGLRSREALWKDGEGQLARLYADASTELSTPLSVLIASLEDAISADHLDEAARRDAERTRVIANALQRRVDDLLLRARADSAELLPRLTKEDVALLVRNACSPFEGLAQRRGLRFFVDTPPSVVGAIDRDMIEKVVLNLLFNAFKVTPPAGTIRCTLEVIEPDTLVRITVIDSGPGVPDERKPTLFDRRASSIGDAGLGLHLSRGFARLHGGDIVVEDAPLTGAPGAPGAAGAHASAMMLKAGAKFAATFRIDGSNVADTRSGVSTAPQRLAALAEAELAVPVVPASDDLDDPTGPQAKPRVLVVEDEVDVARHLRRALEKAFEIAVVHNGREALQQALHAPPDLILTDVMLPEMDGEALLRAIQADEELGGIPVVVLTGQDDRTLRLRMLRAGAQDFLTKPYQPEELVQRLQNQIAQKRARDILAREVSARTTDLEGLARSVSEHRRQLEDAVAQLAIARDLAEAASRVKSNFLRMMSHEVRTPIAALDIHLGALVTHAHEQLDEDARTHVQGIGRASARLIEIVETVVEWARIDAGRFRARAAPFSLGDLAIDVAKDFAAHAELKGLELRVQLPAQPLSPLVNDRAITRLIGVNLVGNAVKYTPRGSVVVFVEQRGEVQVLRIEDTGPGIPKAHHQAVFEPFRQLDDVGHTHGTGSGLGLAIVKDLVEAIGGRIELDSDTGQGTKITVTLPMLDGESTSVTNVGLAAE